MSHTNPEKLEKRNRVVKVMMYWVQNAIIYLVCIALPALVFGTMIATMLLKKIAIALKNHGLEFEQSLFVSILIIGLSEMGILGFIIMFFK